MKIAIASDSHDNLAAIDKFNAYVRANKIDAVVHCGDLSSGDAFGHLAAKFSGTIYLALGNADDKLSLAACAKRSPEKLVVAKGFCKVEFDGLQVGFCHYKNTAESNCRKNKLDFVFYGHSHKPWMETINGCALANPGNLAGVFYKATFAILNTTNRSLELKILERL